MVNIGMVICDSSGQQPKAGEKVCLKYRQTRALAEHHPSIRDFFEYPIARFRR
jgi:hypothetical protein